MAYGLAVLAEIPLPLLPPPPPQDELAAAPGAELAINANPPQAQLLPANVLNNAMNPQGEEYFVDI